MENLRAALPQSHLTSMSDQEFQKMLSAWFEEKGIVSDLRSQVRFKMINVLKNTMIGRDICRKTTHLPSLSKQALNLIVAEHLVQNKCQYSLLIFNTEASVSNMFPEYPAPLEFVTSDDTGKTFFDKENLLHILELVGIPKNTKNCEEILKLYYTANEDKSLLSCLIAWLSKITTWSRMELTDDFKSLDLRKDPRLIQQIANLLMEFDLSAKSFKTVVETIRLLYLSELQNIEITHTSQISVLKKEIDIHEKKARELHRSKKVLENKVLQLASEYNVLKRYSEDFKKENEGPDKNTMTKETPNVVQVPCELLHCTETCQKIERDVKDLIKENRELKRQNSEQRQEILCWSRKYSDVLRSFTDWQNKITLLNSRINDGGSRSLLDYAGLYDYFAISEAKLENKAEITSDVSSDSITEEILKETRLRLKILEEESKELEDKCFPYLAK